MCWSTVQVAKAILCFYFMTLAWPYRAYPQDAAAQSPGVQDSSSASGGLVSGNDPLTLFPHSQTSRYWISGQANIVLQWHASFPAKYSGEHSLLSRGENATSKVYTLFLGYELTPTTEVFLDFESAGGRGISHALGLAGFVNLDVIRNPVLGPTPYLARLMLRQIIPLSDKRIEAERGPLGLATSLPARRIEFHIGKFSMADFFDLNRWGSDSHLQFLNWAVDNNDAYNYAGSARGYTDGVVIEYDDHWFSARFAEVLMPKTGTSQYLDADIARAHSENLELEAHGSPIAHREGVVRVLGYVSTAYMGNYRQAVEDYLDGTTSAPDVISTRRQGRHLYGFGINWEQEITSDVGIFGRLGWSDGRNESFQVDHTLELGGFSTGNRWHRRNDRSGVAFAMNGIGPNDREYRSRWPRIPSRRWPSKLWA